ncbi:MAG: hypothetical protein ACREXT_06360 [Gammaproteobacteria bacterium]
MTNPEPVDMERIERECNEYVVEIRRQSALSYLAIIRAMMEPLAVDPIPIQVFHNAGTSGPGLESKNWKPDDTTPFRTAATQCLALIREAEAVLSDQNAQPSALSRLWVDLISIGELSAQAKMVFQQTLIDAGLKQRINGLEQQALRYGSQANRSERDAAWQRDIDRMVLSDGHSYRGAYMHVGQRDGVNPDTVKKHTRNPIAKKSRK